MVCVRVCVCVCVDFGLIHFPFPWFVVFVPFPSSQPNLLSPRTLQQNKHRRARCVVGTWWCASFEVYDERVFPECVGDGRGSEGRGSSLSVLYN